MPTLADVLDKIIAGEAVKTDMNSCFPTQDLYFMEASFELSPVISDPAGRIEPSSILFLAKGTSFLWW